MPADEKTLLIIDDDTTFKKTLQGMLEGERCKILYTYDSAGGWEFVVRHHPDLILLSCSLPRLAGQELLLKLKSSPETRGIPVIVVAILANQDAAQKAVAMGAEDSIVKGMNSPKEITGKIRVWLRKAEVNRQVNSDELSLMDLASFELRVKDGGPEAERFLRAFGMTPGFLCDSCRVEMALELFLDRTKTGGHWFTTHFTCPKCKKSF